ncbi:MAG: hypothetical protein Q7U02_07510 [Desulfosalsimonadaceae bacterium]|nr:hypothetical protein [Desulfosalsimonadaceae bacterium]
MFKTKKAVKFFLHGFLQKKTAGFRGCLRFLVLLDDVLLSHRQSLAKIIIAKIPKVKISDCGAVHFIGALSFYGQFFLWRLKTVKHCCELSDTIS